MQTRRSRFAAWPQSERNPAVASSSELSAGSSVHASTVSAPSAVATSEVAVISASSARLGPSTHCVTASTARTPIPTDSSRARVRSMPYRVAQNDHSEKDVNPASADACTTRSNASSSVPIGSDRRMAGQMPTASGWRCMADLVVVGGTGCEQAP